MIKTQVVGTTMLPLPGGLATMRRLTRSSARLSLALTSDGLGRGPTRCRPVRGVSAVTAVVRAAAVRTTMWLPRVQSAVYGRTASALV